MRKHGSPLVRDRVDTQANGFVNRRSTVQSCPPAPEAQNQGQVGAPKRGSTAVTPPVLAPRVHGELTDVQRADWIRHVVADYGVPLAAAIAADRAIQRGRRERSAAGKVAAMHEATALCTRAICRAEDAGRPAS